MLIPTHIEASPLYGLPFGGDSRPVQVEPLTEDDREAALDFLSERPIHTVILAGWIREYGVQNPHHRGTFYGCWNAHGILEGVALIGRATLFETRSQAALNAFAQMAKRDSTVHLLFAEASELEKFWQSYRHYDQTPKLICHELLYEREAEPFNGMTAIDGLRRARIEELTQVTMAHAQIIKEETGENPLDKDPQGFSERCAARIEQDKVWILIEEGEVIFKADVVAETPDAVYVEGLWINPLYRRKGYGALCWEALSRALLTEATSLCGFVNDQNSRARAFYDKVGCRAIAQFDKIFV